MRETRNEYKNITQEKWDKAVEWVNKLLEEYQNLGIIGMFGTMVLRSYIRRYEAGERSEDLYESMDTAE